MKPMKTLITILFISLLSSPSWSVTLGDLVSRNGLHYEKFTDIPFTGEVTGDGQGSYKNGKREGAWVSYHDNGQLSYKGNYKNDKIEGSWTEYHENGQLWLKGSYKNGEREGAWVGYHDNGWGMFKGNYNSGNEEGAWVGYYKDRTVNIELTGAFKDGVKISD